MSDVIEVRTNIAGFRKELVDLGNKIQKKAIRGALSATAKVFKAAAVERAPVLSKSSPARSNRTRGALKKSIIIVRRRDAAPGTEKYVVDFRRRGGNAAVDKSGKPYGLFLERGWDPANRKRGKARKNAKRRAQRKHGSSIIIKYRFLAPAFRDVKDTALEVFNSTLAKNIQELKDER